MKYLTIDEAAAELTEKSHATADQLRAVLEREYGPKTVAERRAELIPPKFLTMLNKRGKPALNKRTLAKIDNQSMRQQKKSAAALLAMTRPERLAQRTEIAKGQLEDEWRARLVGAVESGELKLREPTT